MKGLAPIHIKPLLEIYACVLLEDMPSVTPTIIDELEAFGLIKKSHDILHIDGYDEKDICEYKVTEKGDVYVEALMNVPLPVQRWEIP